MGGWSSTRRRASLARLWERQLKSLRMDPVGWECRCKGHRSLGQIAPPQNGPKKKKGPVSLHSKIKGASMDPFFFSQLHHIKICALSHERAYFERLITRRPDPKRKRSQFESFSPAQVTLDSGAGSTAMTRCLAFRSLPCTELLDKCRPTITSVLYRQVLDRNKGEHKRFI